VVPSVVPDVRVLGPVEVVGPAGPAQLVGVRQRAVVALLALRVGTVVPQWRLVDALWADDPPRTAVKSLHSYVARVRQALEACGLPDVVVTRESGYALMLPADAVDAWRFEDLARLGRAELDTAAARAADHLREGLALWRSEIALADAEPTGWGAAEVARLAEVRLTAIEDQWTAQLRLGRHAAAVGEVERLLVAHPLRERMVGLLMLARYRCGQQAEALDAYQRLRARLADELGVDPGPELAALHTRILRREPDLDPAEPADRAGVAMPVPAQLPARVGHFAGRTRELATLDRLLADAPGDDAGIAVVPGPAGVGKTALAVQWAHAVADRFPDGQLFLDLRGHDARAALTPAEALAHLLRSLGVPADRIPADQAECAGLYRSLMNGKRILVVLDNAPAADRIVPLIPASTANRVVVTGRSSMTALATRHAVLPVVLDVLTDGEAVDLLVNVLGSRPVAEDPAAAAEVARLCGGLPLALRIAAAKLVGHPERRIRDVVTELAGANRLDVLAVDGDSRSVRTVLASAYRELSAPAARVFRLLGLHPGPTFDAHVAAALAGIPLAEASAAVTELAAVHLATPAGRSRYRCHDLVRLFARQCAEIDEPPRGRVEAGALLVDWYRVAVGAACRVIEPGRDRVTTPPPRSPELLPFAQEHHAALEFLDGERDNLLPIVRYAADHGHEAAAWQLTYLLTGFYDSRGHWRDRVEMCRVAVDAAARLGDPAAQGLMQSALGVARIMTREFHAALESLTEALSVMRACGDRRGEGHVLNNMAAAYSRLRRFDDAVGAFRQALALHTASGHQLGVALALNNTGHTYVRMGDPERGLGDLTAALEISREIGNPRLEAAVLHSLGEAALMRGEPAEALDHLGRALEVHRLIGDRQYEAETLDGLGLAYLGQGKVAEAFDHLYRALGLTRDIADPHLEAITLANLGRAHLEEGNLAVAAEHLRLSLALRTRVPDPHEEARVHCVLAELERRAG
jgi:DNA-binding SARP family transcriptional activator/Tfp pilus assembly protein PilF